MSLLGFLAPYITPATTAVGSYLQGRNEAQQREAASQQSKLLQMIAMRRQQQQDQDAQAMSAARMAELKSQTAKRDLDATLDRRAYDTGKRQFADDPDYPDEYTPGDYVNLNKSKRSEGITKEKEKRQNELDRYTVQVLYPDVFEKWAPLENDPEHAPNWSKVLAYGTQGRTQEFQQGQQQRGFTQQNVNREDSQTFQQGQQQRAFGQQNVNREDSQAFAQGQQQRAQDFSQAQQGRAFDQQTFLAQQKKAGGMGGVQTKVGMNRAWVRQVERAINEVRTHPEAFSMGRAALTDVTGKWGERAMQRIDPGSQNALSQLQDITSKMLHDRSGAAVTVSEWERMRQFLPQQGDTPEKIIMNLENMKRTAEEETSELEKLSRPWQGDTRQSAPLTPTSPRPGSAAGSIRSKTDDLISKYRK